MKKYNENLKSKLCSGIRNTLYAGTISLASMLSSSYIPINAQEAIRVTEVETFDSEETLTKSDIRYPDEYPSEGVGGVVNTSQWHANTRMECDNYEGKSGFLRYSFNDKKFLFKNINGSISVACNKTEWNAGDFVGVIFAGDPIGHTYYQAELQANPRSTVGGQFSIVRYSPQFSYLFVNKTNIDLGGVIIRDSTNTLKVDYSNKKWNFYINDNKLDIEDVDGASLTEIMGDVEGYVGMSSYDAAPEPGDVFATNFDNFTFEYDSVQGAGAGLEDKLQPDANVKVFLRGDANMDKKIDITDAIHTLRYLFTDGPLQCPDAADANDNESLDISDPIKIILHLFKGQLLPPPNVGGPGIDLTRDKTDNNLPECQGYEFDWSKLK